MTIRRVSPVQPQTQVTIRRPSGRRSPYWPSPDFDPGNVPGPVPNSGGSYTERTYTAPGSILDQVPPMVYGSMKVPGYCAAWSTSSTALNMAFIFCHGEQAGLGSIMVNDEAIAGLPWVTSYHTFLGDGTGTKPAEMSFVSTAAWAKMLNYCMVTMSVRIKQANCPGSFNTTAVPTGRKFASFRSPYTESNYTNLAEIAYDILTDAVWKGLTSVVAGVESGGTWERFADHCDEVMGDASKRYTFNGVISERDPDKAIDLVLQAGFASKYFTPDGKIQIWSEAPPPAISGTWTASASTTLTGSGGDASNELETDDIIYAGTTPCIVVSTSGTGTIVVDRAVTISAATVRKTSGVYLRSENWMNHPEGQEAETGAIPDEVEVRYTLSNYWGSMMYPEEPTEDKRVEVTVEACNNASMARRISETKRDLMALQPFTWKGVADTSASGLEPGDVFFFDDDVLTFQPARALPPIPQNRDGSISLSFRSYAIDAVSDSTQTDPTIPTPPTSYQSGGTPHFQSINSITSGGTAYSFFSWSGANSVVGDGSVVQVLDGVSIRLPNNVALLGITTTGGTVQMFKVNTSDELELGDGSVPIYFNGSAFILDVGDSIQGGHATKAYLLGYSATYGCVLGSGAYPTLLDGTVVALADGKLKGIVSGTGNPTTTDFGTDQWGVYHKTDSPIGFMFVANIGGSIHKIGLA